LYGDFSEVQEKKKNVKFSQDCCTKVALFFSSPIDRREKKVGFFFATVGRYRLCSLRSASGGPCGELASGGPCGELSVFESKTFFRLFIFLFFPLFFFFSPPSFFSFLFLPFVCPFSFLAPFKI